MTKSILAILLLVSRSALSVAPPQLDWAQIPWGTKDIAAVLKPYYEADPPDLFAHPESYKVSRIYKIQGRTLSCDTVLHRFLLGEKPTESWIMEVYFLRDEEGRLSAIQLESDIWNGGEAVFKELTNYLTKKYGAPDKITQYRDAGPLNITREYGYWRTKSLTLTLLNLTIPDQGIRRISITYQKPRL